MLLFDQSINCVCSITKKVVSLPFDVATQIFNLDLDDLIALIKSLEPGPLKLLTSDEPPLQILIDEVTNRALINFWARVVEMIFAVFMGLVKNTPDE